jgi:hypothetical protein
MTDAVQPRTVSVVLKEYDDTVTKMEDGRLCRYRHSYLKTALKMELDQLTGKTSSQAQSA